MTENEYECAKEYIGKVIKKHRRMKKNISLEKLAEEIDVDANNLSRIERGQQVPHLFTYLLIVHELGIEQDDDFMQAIITMIKKDKQT